MSYSEQETSVESSQPVELYKFSQRLGTARTTLTSGQLPIVKDGDTYLPSTIKRSAPKLAQGASGAKITMTVPRDHEYALRYLTGEPPLPDEVTIYRGHTTDEENAEPEWRVLFSGEVAGVRFEGDMAKVILVSLTSRLKRTIPKRTYSWSCNHVLYDTKCQVDRNLRFSLVDVAGIDESNTVLTVIDTPGSAYEAATSRADTDTLYFDGGYVEITTAFGTFHRTIVHYNVNTGDLALSVPVAEVLQGATLKIYAGCSHDIFTCAQKFNNVGNYGGFPFVPTTNPFADGLVKGRM